MARQVTYHVKLGSPGKQGRTTVSVDATLSELLALDLGVEPDAPNAHAAVRRWLQAELDRQTAVRVDRGFAVSQWLRRRAIKRVIRADLARAYDTWKNLARQGEDGDRPERDAAGPSVSPAPTVPPTETIKGASEGAGKPVSSGSPGPCIPGFARNAPPGFPGRIR